MKTAPEPLGSGAVLQALTPGGGTAPAAPPAAHPGAAECPRRPERAGEAPVEKGSTSSCCSTTAPPRVTSSRWTARHSLSPSRLEKVRVSRGGAVAHGLAGVEGPGQRPRRAGQQHRPAGDGPRAAQPRAAGDAVSSSSRAPASSAGCRPARTSAASSPNPASTAVRIPSSRSQIPTRKLRHLPLCCSVRKIWDFMRHLSRNAARALTFAA